MIAVCVTRSTLPPFGFSRFMRVGELRKKSEIPMKNGPWKRRYPVTNWVCCPGSNLSYSPFSPIELLRQRFRTMKHDTTLKNSRSLPKSKSSVTIWPQFCWYFFGLRVKRSKINRNRSLPRRERSPDPIPKPKSLQVCEPAHPSGDRFVENLCRPRIIWKCVMPAADEQLRGLNAQKSIVDRRTSEESEGNKTF